MAAALVELSVVVTSEAARVSKQAADCSQAGRGAVVASLAAALVDAELEVDGERRRRLDSAKDISLRMEEAARLHGIQLVSAMEAEGVALEETSRVQQDAVRATAQLREEMARGT